MLLADVFRACEALEGLIQARHLSGPESIVDHEIRLDASRPGQPLVAAQSDRSDI
jgi:hypothetical protein